MAWTRRFVSDLTRGTEAPSYIVRSVVMPEPVGTAWSIRGPQSPNLLQRGLVDKVDIGGSRVSTESWSATTGGITVSLIGDVSGLLIALRHGQIAEVLAGFSGYDDADYNTIAIGQVQGFVRRGVTRAYTLTMRDVWASLQSRFSTSADELALFAGLPPPTTVLNNYVAGDPTIDIALTPELPKETGANGAFAVADNGGATFYITWSSSALIGPGRTYTIVAAGALSTVDANAGGGNIVTPIAYIKDEPVDIIRKILVSTGTGTNGPWDTLPQTWGFGIPDRIVDHSDLDNTKALTRTANASRAWEAWSDVARDNGLSWVFGDVFQDGGFFPVVHQGGMSVRAAVEPFNPTVNLAAANVRGDPPFIHDGLLAKEPLDGWEAWSPDHPTEARRFTTIAGVSSNSLTETVGSLPAVDTKSVDVTPWVHNNVAQHLAALNHRLHVWAHRVPERFTIRLPNLMLATHAVGGVPRLTSAVLHGRLESTVGGFSNVPVFVTQVLIDWQRRTMKMSFEVVSASSDDS